MSLINKNSKVSQIKYTGNSEPATIHNVQVGTIITYAYSYNCRIPIFARVIKRTNSSVQIEELEKMITSDDGYGQNGKCKANLEGKTQVINKQFRFKRNTGRLVINGRLAYIYRGFEEDFYSD